MREKSEVGSATYETARNRVKDYFDDLSSLRTAFESCSRIRGSNGRFREFFFEVTTPVSAETWSSAD
jgi:hypothetical protein